ncbi:MAG: hypothetical protein ACJ76Q_17315 [Solirubrobacteraceae bacterium]
MTKLQTPAIEALDLRKRYRHGTEVLRGVSFAVQPGTIFTYLGRGSCSSHSTSKPWPPASRYRSRLRP